MVSPATMFTLVPLTIISKSKPGWAVTISVSFTVPASMSSMASSTVITLVRLAG